MTRPYSKVQLALLGALSEVEPRALDALVPVAYRTPVVTTRYLKRLCALRLVDRCRLDARGYMYKRTARGTEVWHRYA